VNGLRAAAATEAAFRQELIALAIAIPLAIVIATDNWTRLALIGVVLALLIVELLNTAIEKLADRVTLEHDPLIGRVKDMGSAAVGLTLLIAALVWLLMIWQRIAELLS
jgi:diacylglycerol kinase (ATP)